MCLLFPVADSLMPTLLRLSHFVLQCLCLVQSYWTDWSEWGPCSTTFCNDAGIQVRQRKCVNTQPMPLLLVPACQGHHSERRECSTPPCTGVLPAPNLCQCLKLQLNEIACEITTILSAIVGKMSSSAELLLRSTLYH